MRIYSALLETNIRGPGFYMSDIFRKHTGVPHIAVGL